MNNSRNIFHRFLLFALVLQISCTGSKLKPEEVSSFINDPGHGLIKERKTNDITIKVKYLPPGLLAYKEYRDAGFRSQQQFDSLCTLYDSGLTFVLEIIPEERNEDLMLKDIQSEQEYKERVNNMNFNLKDFMEIKIGANTILPSIANLENIYGLKNSRKIMVVFPLDPTIKREQQNIQFTFTDEIYSTGINHFIFLAEDLSSIPEIKL